MRSVKIFIVLVFLEVSASAQKADSASYYFTGMQAHYGFIIPHTEAIEPVSHTSPYGLEISFNKLHTSYNSWRVLNRYTISGFQAGYFNFQNPEILGKAYTLTVFNETILAYGKKYIFSVKAGSGFSYQTKIYNYYNNDLNRFFSTRISFPLYLMARIKYKAGNKTYITLSGCYNHISNGGIRVPNYGMNFPTLNLGIEYFNKPVPQLGNDYVPYRNVKEDSHTFVFQALTGYKVVYGNPAYAFGLHIRYMKQLRTHYGLNAGAEIIMDGGIREIIKIKNLDLDYKRIAVTAGQDFLFGKVIFTQYFGLYIYSPYKAKAFIYQKYELSYKIIPELMVGVYLKAHTSEAELLGLSFSYLLNRN